MSQLEQEVISTATLPAAIESTAESATMRVRAMDVHRGVIMVLMALCHCRDYVGGDYYENLDWNTPALWQGATILEFIQQAFCSIIAAGGFFMLMGIGMIFFWDSRTQEGWTPTRMAKYLITRGMILVVLQLTLLQAFEIYTEGKILFYAGVLMSLGLCMVFAAILLYTISKLNAINALKKYHLSYALPLFFTLLITCSLQVMISHLQQMPGDPALWKILFFVGGEYQRSIYLDINFTPIPWLPAVTIGMIIGQLMTTKNQASFKWIGWIALSLLAAFFLMRYANLQNIFQFGSYKLLDAGQPLTFASFFDVSKYPPSISYFLWSLGFNLALLYTLHIAEAFPTYTKLSQPIKVFGQCALFFFVIHWFVYYSLSLIFDRPNMTSINIVAVWLLGVCLLYPLCKLYNRFKQSKSKDSLWRMF